jgi:hypothetical protein
MLYRGGGKDQTTCHQLIKGKRGNCPPLTDLVGKRTGKVVYAIGRSRGIGRREMPYILFHQLYVIRAPL